MYRRILLIAALAISLVVSATGARDVVRAHAASPCLDDAKTGRHLIRSAEGECVDNTPMSTEDRAVLNAKEAYANALADVANGSGSQQKADAALRRVEAATGQKLTPKSQGPMPLASVASPSYAQINWYYCGPATAENILWLIGPRTSATKNTLTNTYQTLNGDPNHDQPIFGGNFWLQTDRNSGTNWVENTASTMPFTLNRWVTTLNGTFYVPAGVHSTPTALTGPQAWLDINSDLTLSHPVAENVLYAGSTYLPPGFGSGSFLHWDTVFGNDTSFNVGIAQSYGSPRTPWYWKDWSHQWSAISSNQGIVW